MPAINNFRISLLVIVMILASLTDASAAPDALKGKTITIVWTEVRQEKLDSLDSNTTSVTVNFTQKTYVSEIGRAFTRMTDRPKFIRFGRSGELFWSEDDRNSQIQ